MYNKLLGRGSETIYVRKKLQTRFINLIGVVIPPNFLIFCKKLFSQANNEKVNVSTHKKNFLSEKKVN